MSNGINISRFKIYISYLFKTLDTNEIYDSELAEIKKARKNIGSIITTNYDNLIENIFDFIPLIGNNILLSEPYGSLYKIHGSVNHPLDIIINEKDYENFNIRYELIRAQLLSIFINNPIIFIGYSMNDSNIKDLLKTIFKYVPANSEVAASIRKNFLLIDYKKDSDSDEVTDHDIEIDGISMIRINKISTDNYNRIYRCISNLSLSVSAMDIRKVQNAFKEIRAGGSIKVKITEDIDGLNNDEKILAIGSTKSIKYEYRNKKDLLSAYFDIINEENKDIIKIIDKLTIGNNEWFPACQFYDILPELKSGKKLRNNQRKKLKAYFEDRTLPQSCKFPYKSIELLLASDAVAATYKETAIGWAAYNDHIILDDLEYYLLNVDLTLSNNRRMLCVYDYKKSLANSFPKTKTSIS